MDSRVTFDISTRAILKVIGIFLGIWLIYEIREIVLLLFVVIILVMALAPVVDRWQKIMPRGLAVGIVFFIIIAALSLIFWLIVPPLVSQISDLAFSLPRYGDRLQEIMSNLTKQTGSFDVAEQAIQTLSDQLSKLSQGIFQRTIGVVGGFFTFVTAIVLAIYLLFEEQGLKQAWLSLLPIERKVSFAHALAKIGDKLGSWLRGQLFLMLLIGVISGFFAAILGLPYALALGLWAGLTEVIPYIGPILGAIPIVLIAFLDSPLKAIVALVLLVLTQQLESNFLVPKIMQKAVGISPVVVILALMIGGKLFGITGTILAVPIAATIAVLIQEWPHLTKVIVIKEPKKNRV